MPTSRTERTADATGYFSGLASVYARNRPTYPKEAIDFILDGLVDSVHVADIGCGTGISTRLLAASGHAAQVIGIDPNADMLEQARRQQSAGSVQITYRVGTGERTGLGDESVGAVVCAQAFHWFDPPAALREFHRILTANGNGRLALMWNVKDSSNEFSAGYTDINTRAMADAASRGLTVRSEREADPALGGYFGNVRQRVFMNPQQLDLEGVLGRMASASYFPKQQPLRGQMQEELREHFHRHQRDGIVILMHRTEVTLADRVNRA